MESLMKEKKKLEEKELPLLDDKKALVGHSKPIVADQAFRLDGKRKKAMA